MTDLTPPTSVPSTPNQDLVVLVVGVLRDVLKLLAGVGVTVGSVSDSKLWIVASALVWLSMTGWSWYQKRKAKQLDHEGTLMSLNEGKPVQPSVKAI